MRINLLHTVPAGRWTILTTWLRERIPLRLIGHDTRLRQLEREIDLFVDLTGARPRPYADLPHLADHFDLDDFGRPFLETSFSALNRGFAKKSGTTVIIKTARPDEAATFYLRRESILWRHLEDLKTPYLPRFHGSFQNREGKLALVFEEIEGQTFERWLHAGHSLTPRETVTFFQEVCEGLGFLHRRGLYHQDLSDNNLLARISEGRLQPVIIDLGLARPTLTYPRRRLDLHSGTEGFIARDLWWSGRRKHPPHPAETQEVYAVGANLYRTLLVEGRDHWLDYEVLATPQLRRIMLETLDVAHKPPPQREALESLVDITLSAVHQDFHKRPPSTFVLGQQLGQWQKNYAALWPARTLIE